MTSHNSVPDYSDETPRGWFSRGLAAYRACPLYLRILIGMALGVVAGLALKKEAQPLMWGSKLVLQFLTALAPALILVAVVDAILNANVQGRHAARLVFLLILNTLVAIVVGLCVANAVRPGVGAHPDVKAQRELPKSDQVGQQLYDQIPTSLLGPLVTNNVIGVVIVAVVFGIAFRRVSLEHDLTVVNQFVRLLFRAITVVLHWVLDVVPIAVFCTVAYTIGMQGFAPFVKLAWFMCAVLLALGLQLTWYLARVRYGSWVRPGALVRGMRDAMFMAFSTASSTVTMPVTYACLREKVGLREDSASMGALVGSNFNNDGTALYEAMAALFVAQMIGYDLSLGQQVVIVLMSVIASVGAAGIPEAGLVTMTLVFSAVGLPKEYILFLIPVDWFLDRCRTVINMMGDVNVACLLDGKVRTAAVATPVPLLEKTVTTESAV
ncbi:MAG: dicarboxylate/amino acid:cation symporter [Phycisphaerae bacterium]|nr:dicarboxylate/amino acid:cation symporter [Tepidisphaeraceae bacterium]